MRALMRWIGVELDEASWVEKLVSALGAFVAIALIIEVSHEALGYSGSRMIVASMGASAVLLFGVPHGQLSQPWPLVAGHLGAAVIGVTCARTIDNTQIAGALAVGLTVAVMHQCKCIHPPGGATALTAVLGGPAVRSLGYGYVLNPVLLNCLVIVVVAIAFNGLFAWRRYPAHLVRREAAVPPIAATEHAALVEALRQIDTFVDVNEDDVLRIHRLLNEEERRRNTTS